MSLERVMAWLHQHGQQALDERTARQDALLDALDMGYSTHASSQARSQANTVAELSSNDTAAPTTEDQALTA